MDGLPAGARFAALYAALFLVLGVVLPFLPLWLADRGLDPAEIGLVLGAPAILRVVVTPFLAELADRTGRPVLVLRLAVAATLVGYGLLAASAGFWPLLFANLLTQTSSAAVLPLLDSLVMRQVAARPGGFGPVRLWGSVAFIAGSLGGGLFVAAVPIERLVLLIAGCQALAVLVATGLVREAPAARAGRRAAAPPTRTLLTRPVLLVVVASTLIQATHGAYYGFGSVHWRDLGFGGSAIGALWSLGIVAEIAVLWGSARLPARIGPLTLLAAGAVAAVVRWGGMALDPTGLDLVLLQMLHGLSFAATYLGAVRAIAALTPAGAEARAQSLAMTANGVAIAATIAVSGPLHEAAGAGMYLAMAGIGALGGLVLLAGRGALAQPHRAREAGKTVDPS